MVISAESCFVIFNVTRVILETLPSHVHFVVTACRCEVPTHAATFCSLVEKTPRARESVETFSESRDILNQCFAKF